MAVNEDVEERHDQIARMARSGMQRKVIARRLGVHIRTVDRVLSDRGLTKGNPPKMTVEEIERARALLEDGASYYEAARSIGRSSMVLRRKLPGYQWDKVKSGEHGQVCKKMRRVLQ